MWHLAAAEQTANQDGQTAIILGVIGLLTAVLVAVATGVFTLLSAKAGRTAPAPPPPVTNVVDGDMAGLLRERVAVLEDRADDSDDRDAVQDRRLDQLERHADLDNPEWRHDGRH